MGNANQKSDSARPSTEVESIANATFVIQWKATQKIFIDTAVEGDVLRQGPTRVRGTIFYLIFFSKNRPNDRAAAGPSQLSSESKVALHREGSTASPWPRWPHREPQVLLKKLFFFSKMKSSLFLFLVSKVVQRPCIALAASSRLLENSASLFFFCFLKSKWNNFALRERRQHTRRHWVSIQRRGRTFFCPKKTKRKIIKGKWRTSDCGDLKTDSPLCQRRNHFFRELKGRRLPFVFCFCFCFFVVVVCLLWLALFSFPTTFSAAILGPQSSSLFPFPRSGALSMLGQQKTR